MADCIPKRIPSSASQGERRTFNLLRNLPDDYLVYYEPSVSNRNPDFVVIGPDLGVVIIEVKGWFYDDILRLNNKEVIINYKNCETSELHPLEQARGYLWKIKGNCDKNPKKSVLLNKDGKYKNKFCFPFCHFVILSNISRDNVERHVEHDLYEIFRPENTLFSDQLRDLENADPEKIKKTLRNFCDPFWEFSPLTLEQIDVIRSILHPEIILSYIPSKPVTPEEMEQYFDLEVLDRKQENNARMIGEGHRIIYGVAGSGKTVLLVARAKWLHDRDPEAKILVLCYNVTLSAYLKHALKGYPRVEIFHFDGWAIHNGIHRYSQDPATGDVEKDVNLGVRLLEFLKLKSRDYRNFNAILVDEAQDFPPVWFSCILEAMDDPINGDLLIVCDGNQGIRLIEAISWKSLGIKAQGRTIHSAFDLDRNYRNTREILQLASHFTSRTISDNEDSISIVPVNPNQAIRRGSKPRLIKGKDHTDECRIVTNLVRLFIEGKVEFQNKKIQLRPKDIGILYRKKPYKEQDIFEKFLDDLSTIAPVTWLNRDRYSRTQVFEPTIKVQTIASAKGLQYKAVFLMWSDLFATSADPENEQRYLYVALTRAENTLIISYSEINEFIEKMINSGDCVLIQSNADNQKRNPSEDDKANSLEKIRQKHPNAYAPWTQDDDEKLTNLHFSEDFTDKVRNKIITILEMGETRSFRRGGFHTFVEDQIAALAVEFELKSRRRFGLGVDDALWGSADVGWLMDSIPVAVFEIDSSFRVKSIWNLTQKNIPNKFWVYCGKMDIQTLKKIEAIEKDHGIHVIHLNRTIPYIRGRSKTGTPEPVKEIPKMRGKKPESHIPPSLMETYNLYFEDYPVEKIAEIRGFKPSTIIDHFIQLMRLGIFIEIDKLVSEEKRMGIIEAIDQTGYHKLKPLKDQLGPDYSYDEIKLVVAYEDLK